MTVKQARPLPIPGGEYSEENEAVTRRQIEHNFRQVNEDLDDVYSGFQGSGSLHMRKFQFLLMGASNG